MGSHMAGAQGRSTMELTGVTGLCNLLAVAATFIEQVAFARHFTYS